MIATRDRGVTCVGVTKRFGSVEALVDADLRIGRGEIVALLGPSGCGKTTFLRVLAGFERPDAGRVEIGGRTVVSAETFVPPEARRVGLVFQDHALFPHLTVADNVGFGVPASARAGTVDEMLALVGLTGLGARRPHGLSGGQQQRVALARALAARPDVMLLDEPFSNLDADLRLRVRNDAGQILRRAGVTTVLVTHDQQEAFDLADRVAVMQQGRIEQVGRPEEVYHLPRTRFVADFVGEATFLPVRVERNAITSELGWLPSPPPGLPVGPAEVMLRPEDIVLGPAREGSVGVVVGRRFQGPTALTTVRLPSGSVVTSSHTSQSVFEQGSAVHVRLELDHIVLFRGDEVVARVEVRAHTGTDAVTEEEIT